ncbi:hypothetical protein [Sodalis sp. RH22]|uniref:hypothetical protein n=1 Tax=unclassified Sodalis (in: enterobacteria) TaxID=2636512 RepID=UPI0039B66F21
MAWSDIKSIESLQVSFTTTNRVAYIYGNGFNTVEVIIYIKALDEFGQEFTDYSLDEFRRNVNLIEVIRTAHLSQNPNNSTWFVVYGSLGFDILPPAPSFAPVQDTPSTYILPDNTETNADAHQTTFEKDPMLENSYSSTGYYQGDINEMNMSERFRETESQMVPVDGLIETSGRTFSYFVGRGAASPSRTIEIAVQLTLTHPAASPKVISTGLYGTPGFFSSVTINALDPIDYSDARNVTLSQRSRETLRDNIYWESHRLVTYYHYNGTLDCVTINLYPKIGGTFLLAEPMDIISDADLNLGNDPWGGAGFTGIAQGSSYLYSRPFSVMERGWGRSYYQVNFWYVKPFNPEVQGHFLGYASGFAFKLFTSLNAGDVDNNITNPATLVMYQFSIWGETDIVAHYWSSGQASTRVISLTDKYGNKGNLTLYFNTNDYFDVPQLR